LIVRIFMEGQEQWLEPCGEVMVVIAKLMMGGAFVAFSWVAIVRLMGHQASSETAGLSKPAISAIVFSSLSVAFWFAGRFSIFVGRKMRERGIKLP